MRRYVCALILLAGCAGQEEAWRGVAPPETIAGREGFTVGPQEAVAVTTTTPEPEPTTTHTHAPRPTVTYPPSTTAPAPRSSSSTLASIRACESGGDYSINTGNGYYGAYQFSLSTWRSVGGSGYPHLASPAEQDMRAQIMIDQGRRGEWPNC